jgi:transcriptional regulator GlxA family with amidase domain
MDKQLNVGIFLFNEVELLDFAGPFEVFTVTAELNDYQLFNVFTISESGKGIRTVNGLQVMPDYDFSNHPSVDILVVPGGAGTKNEMTKAFVLKWLKEKHDTSKITMSVCSGTRLLGKLGLLDGLKMITHHEVVEDMKQIAPKAIIEEDVRFTDNGKVLTSAGISAGIELSLHVVEKLYGKVIADKTAVYMEYGDWKKLL